MEDITVNREFFWYLANRSGRRWSAIFLSGGGNDLIDAVWDEGAQKSHILVRPADPNSIDQTNLRSVINRDALDAGLILEEFVVPGGDLPPVGIFAARTNGFPSRRSGCSEAFVNVATLSLGAE